MSEEFGACHSFALSCENRCLCRLLTRWNFSAYQIYCRTDSWGSIGCRWWRNWSWFSVASVCFSTWHYIQQIESSCHFLVWMPISVSSCSTTFAYWRITNWDAWFSLDQGFLFASSSCFHFCFLRVSSGCLICPCLYFYFWCVYFETHFPSPSCGKEH